MAGAQQQAAASAWAAKAASDRLAAFVSAARVASIETARSTATVAAIAWWSGTVARAGGDLSVLPAAACPLRARPADPDIGRAAEAFGADLSALSVEDAVARLGRLYTAMLPDRHRKIHGVYYTPPVLVRRLLDTAERAGVDWSHCKVISPSCGAGAFLVEDARRIVAARGTADPAIVVSAIGSRLRGWDIDPFACWLAQLAVEAVLLAQVVASGRRLPPITECRDSLLDDVGDHAGAYDLVNDNPAFGRVKDRPEIRERYRRSLHGHPNTYGLFTDLAVRLARPGGGIVAYLTPTSWLGGAYFRNLRRMLASEARPASIDIVESRRDAFEGVLQEISLSCFVRGRAEATVACSVAHFEPGGLRVEASGAFALPGDPKTPWILPRGAQDMSVVAAMSRMTWRLKDWGYRVATGPLVWNRHKGRLLSAARRGCVPVVWAESVDQDCRFDYRCEKANHEPYFEPRDGDPNLVRQACLLIQRTTAKEQHRRLIGGVMPQSFLERVGGAVSVENHLNMVIATTTRPAVPLKRLAAFFATAAADRAFRCINASVAVSASELEAMPLPDPCALLTALSAHDPEAAVGHLYGIADAATAAAA